MHLQIKTTHTHIYMSYNNYTLGVCGYVFGTNRISFWIAQITPNDRPNIYTTQYASADMHRDATNQPTIYIYIYTCIKCTLNSYTHTHTQTTEGEWGMSVCMCMLVVELLLPKNHHHTIHTRHTHWKPTKKYIDCRKIIRTYTQTHTHTLCNRII